MADIHGNDVALRAVLDDAAGCQVDRWWVLGDLVLFGPRPAEVLGLLRSLPGIEMLRGNTDRYVLTGEQPAPHATAADAAGSAELVERYGLMAAGIGWTRGVLCQAGLLDSLAGLPSELSLRLPGGTRVLGVHASPGADDGPGIGPAFLTSSSAACWRDAPPASSSAGTPISRLTAASAGSGQLTRAAPGCQNAPARPAGFSLRSVTARSTMTIPGAKPPAALRPCTGSCPTTPMPWPVTCAPGGTRTRSSWRPSSPASASRYRPPPPTEARRMPGRGWRSGELRVEGGDAAG